MGLVFSNSNFPAKESLRNRKIIYQVQVFLDFFDTLSFEDLHSLKILGKTYYKYLS